MKRTFNSLIKQAARKLEQLDFYSAEELYREALAERATNAAALMGMALVFNRTGRSNQAVGLLAPLAERLEQSPMDAASKAALWAQLGQAHLALGEKTLAQEYLYRAERASPSEELRALLAQAEQTAPEPQSDSDVRQRLAQAARLRQEQRWADAEPIYRGLLRKYPDHPTVLHGLALLMRETGRGAEALALIQQALVLDPERPELLNDLGMLFQERGQLEKAVGFHQRALRIRADFGPAYNNLGVALRRLERLGEAEATYRRAIELHDNFAEPHNNLANLLLQQGKEEEARAHLLRALELWPEYREARETLSRLSVKTSKMGEEQQLKQETVSCREVPPVSDNGDARCSWVLKEGMEVHFDRIVALDGVALISGWWSCQAQLTFPTEVVRVQYRRDDAEIYMGRPVSGFAIAASIDPDSGAFPFIFTDGDQVIEDWLLPSSNPESAATIVTEQFSNLQHILPALLAAPAWRHQLLSVVQGVSERINQGRLLDVLWLAGRGVSVTGWVRSRGPLAHHYLVLGDAPWLELEPQRRGSTAAGLPVREEGEDVREPFSALLASCEAVSGSSVWLVVADDEGIFPLHSVMFQPFMGSALEFARRLFALPQPLSQFADQVRRTYLQWVGELQIAEQQALDRLTERLHHFGTQPQAPAVSVVVPLYGRWDFVEHQLLQFSADDQFGCEVELLYVVDDPAIALPLLDSCMELQRLHRLAFTVVNGLRNRGYAAACNLGARHARGAVVIFANSDIFPLTAGWCGSLADALSRHPEIGVIGARLLYADGSIQHQGIDFVYHPALDIWINEHPGQGLLPDSVDGSDPEELENPVAVSGACMAVRREQFFALGGFDSGYLIGDFEDSDLCLKYRAEGLGVGLLPKVELVHLERQSFVAVGEPHFRQQVVIWNAVRHHRLWGEWIEGLADGEEVYG
jgi:Flp pilus assembly protein TadD/GT2 family glycosyltransferase